MKLKICVICKKLIDENDTYFKVELYKQGKLFARDFAHQLCWVNKNQLNNNLGNLVNGLTNYAKGMGFIKEKELEVVI